MGEVPCRDLLGARQTQEAQKCFVLGLGCREGAGGARRARRACEQILLVLQQDTLLLLSAEPPLCKQIAVPGPGPALGFALNASHMQQGPRA